MNADSTPIARDLVEFFEAQLPALLRVIQDSDVAEIELQEGDVRFRVHRSRKAVRSTLPIDVDDLPPTLPAGSALNIPITSPLVGTFYRAETPGTEPLVAEGSRVEVATVVGIVEALNVLTEVEAGCEGTVTKVLATDGQPVEYGQTLFEVLSSA